MDANMKQFIESGKRLLSDTKTPKQKPSKVAPAKMDEPVGDAHDVFVRRTIKEKPSKKDIVVELKKFITVAEKDI
jgi:hypothetical protein